MCVTLPFVCSWVFVFVQKENASTTTFQDVTHFYCKVAFFVCVAIHLVLCAIHDVPYIPRQQPVNMSHLSDVISFVRWPIVCVMYVLCVIGSLC